MTKKQKQKLLRSSLFLLFLALFSILSIVYAEEVYVTSAKINFCDYPSTRRTLRTIGYVVYGIKLAVPIVLIGAAMLDLFKVVISGKDDEMKKAIFTIVKRGIAGLVVFVIPTLAQFLFETLIPNDQTSFTICTGCITEPQACDVDIEEPCTLVDSHGNCKKD